MAGPFKPAGYPSVSPYLFVADAGRTIDFLARAFGGVLLGRFPDEAGRVRHAEVMVGDSVVMLADGGEGWPPAPAHVHVYVPDVDAAYRLALAAGGASVQEPGRTGEEDRRCGVRDAGGTTWWVATRVGLPQGPGIA